MYTPNFCSECGTKLLRLRWHFWTSRRFCDGCARRLWRVRLFPAFLVMLALIGSGYVTGRVGRPAPPPLTIERRFDSPLMDKEAPVSLNSESREAQTQATGSAAAVEKKSILRCPHQKERPVRAAFMGRCDAGNTRACLQCWRRKNCL